MRFGFAEPCRQGGAGDGLPVSPGHEQGPPPLVALGTGVCAKRWHFPAGLCLQHILACICLPWEGLQ